MTKDEALSLAITVGAHIERNSCNAEMLTSFTEHELLAFANAIADAQREKYAEMFSDALQSDLENGVKWLNKHAASEFHEKYPARIKAIGALNQDKE